MYITFNMSTKWNDIYLYTIAYQYVFERVLLAFVLWYLRDEVIGKNATMSMEYDYMKYFLSKVYLRGYIKIFGNTRGLIYKHIQPHQYTNFANQWPFKIPTSKIILYFMYLILFLATSSITWTFGALASRHVKWESMILSHWQMRVPQSLMVFCAPSIAVYKVWIESLLMNLYISIIYLQLL